MSTKPRSKPANDASRVFSVPVDSTEGFGADILFPILGLDEARSGRIFEKQAGGPFEQQTCDSFAISRHHVYVADG